MVNHTEGGGWLEVQEIELDVSLEDPALVVHQRSCEGDGLAARSLHREEGVHLQQ
jgi:hypothetical protein